MLLLLRRKSDNKLVTAQRLTSIYRSWIGQSYSRRLDTSKETAFDLPELSYSVQLSKMNDKADNDGEQTNFRSNRDSLEYLFKCLRHSRAVVEYWQP